jgi:hypothetical protein
MPIPCKALASAKDPSSPLVPTPDVDGFLEDEDLRPLVRKRRTHSPEDLRDAQVLKTSKSRPKTGDFDESTQHCIILAIREYRCQISANVPFPEHAEETKMACFSWEEACQDLDVELSLTPRIIKLV